MPSLAAVCRLLALFSRKALFIASIFGNVNKFSSSRSHFFLHTRKESNKSLCLLLGKLSRFIPEDFAMLFAFSRLFLGKFVLKAWKRQSLS